MLKTSAGILIICQGKGLLAHSTNSPWWRSYTPPKGGVEEGETLEEAASREVFEEVGIKIGPELLKEKVEVKYFSPKGKLYKVVHLFVHEISSYSEIGLSDEHVPFSQLQREEVDEARFMTYDEAEKKLLPRYNEYVKPYFVEDRT
jgi:ADP-ribose pyrophosphatase YjhB (NUDIX family)